MMGMNDWDGLAGDQDGNADAASSPNAKKEVEKKVVPLPAVAAKNNNKTMYLAMGGLMLFVMGVFGYTKYMQIQNMQNEERQQQQQAYKNQKEDAERKKREAAEKDKPAPVANADKPAAESTPAPASQAQNEDLAALAQLKNRNNPNPVTPAAAPATMPPLAVPAPSANVAVARPALQTAPPAQSYAPAQDAQKREQYVSMLEGRVNDLGQTRLRLEAELCKYEPRRTFCGTANKAAAAQEAQREPAQVNTRSIQSAQQAGGRVMLFDTAKAGNAIAPELSRTASKANLEQTQGLPSRTQTMDVTPKAQALQGLTILRDRVLYRDRDGLTHEVELGGTMEGLGRLERIDFERKSFQAGGRTYN